MLGIEFMAYDAGQSASRRQVAASDRRVPVRHLLPQQMDKTHCDYAL
jgi:hypothetical protein